jgi:hypothetical protein
MSATALPNPALRVGHVYTIDDVASLFGVKPHYLRSADDALCVVTDAPISSRRLQFLDSLDVAVLIVDGDKLSPLGIRGGEILKPNGV